MNYDAVAVAGVLLLVVFSASVMAASRVEYGGNLYQFRDSGPAVSSDDASDSKYKFRSLQRHSGSQAPAGRNIGGAAGNDQGYVFRPLRNRNRWIPGSEDIRQDVEACPAIEEKPRQRSFSSPAYKSPAYKPYRPRQRDPGGYQTPMAPPGGYQTPMAPPGGYQTPIAPSGGYQTPIAPPGGYLYPTPEILGYPPW